MMALFFVAASVAATGQEGHFGQKSEAGEDEWLTFGSKHA
jgi:hypothetical protein